MRKLFAVVPEDVYKALRFHAVEHDRDMKDIVTDALRRYLGLKGGEQQKD
jgi:hypothetical protein